MATEIALTHPVRTNSTEHRVLFLGLVPQRWRLASVTAFTGSGNAAAGRAETRLGLTPAELRRPCHVNKGALRLKGALFHTGAAG